jgi:hypothetical protein
MKSTKKTKTSQHDDKTREITYIQPPITALLSEKSLAKDWLKPVEETAWDYL